MKLVHFYMGSSTLLSPQQSTCVKWSCYLVGKSYKPSPFFILDEIDAALDNFNVAKVADFISSKSCEGADGGSGFQSIVIPVKDHLKEKAIGIVVVYRNPVTGCSMTKQIYDLTKLMES